MCGGQEKRSPEQLESEYYGTINECYDAKSKQKVDVSKSQYVIYSLKSLCIKLWQSRYLVNLFNSIIYQLS